MIFNCWFPYRHGLLGRMDLIVLSADLPDSALVLLAVEGRLVSLQPTHETKLMTPMILSAPKYKLRLDPNNLTMKENASSSSSSSSLREVCLHLHRVPHVKCKTLLERRKTCANRLEQKILQRLILKLVVLDRSVTLGLTLLVGSLDMVDPIGRIRRPYCSLLSVHQRRYVVESPHMSRCCPSL